ncbi:MAG: lambda exonuclease family protein [Moraxellaceae bacterium]
MPTLHNLQQGTPEWYAARSGIVTCSELQCLLVKGKDASGFGAEALTYMFKIIGERMTGAPVESFNNQHMERGHALEPVARELYEMATGNTAIECGFMTNHGIGYSPDLLVCDDGLGEIKTKLPHIQAKVLYCNAVPDEHMAQIQGGLWVSEREWLDFISFCSGMPLFVKRVYRDETMIKTIGERVTAFYAELDRRVSVILEHAA